MVDERYQRERKRSRSREKLADRGSSRFCSDARDGRDHRDQRRRSRSPPGREDRQSHYLHDRRGDKDHRDRYSSQRDDERRRSPDRHVSRRDDRRSRSRSASRHGSRRREPEEERRGRAGSRGSESEHWPRGEALQGDGPSRGVLLRSLTPTTTERMINEALEAYAPTQVRLLYRRGSGESRCQALVEFPSVEHAAALIQAYGGSGAETGGGARLLIDRRAVSLEYHPLHTDDVGTVQSAASEMGVEHRGAKSLEWTCHACGRSNYARRLCCYKCNVSAPAIATQGDETDTPGPMLVLKGLPFHANELSVVEALRGPPLQVGVRDMRLLRDPQTKASRGLAYVHMHDTASATRVLEYLEQEGATLLVDNVPLVRAAYAKGGHRATSVEEVTGLRPSEIVPAPPGILHMAGLPPQSSSSGALDGPCVEPSSLPPAAPKARPEWPPSFQEAGASYVLDAHSGYFYEGWSQFYYHPGSGLYYSLTHSAYFRHTPHTHPPFTRFDPPPPPEPPTHARSLPTAPTFGNENDNGNGNFSYSPVAREAAQQPPPATVLNLKGALGGRKVEVAGRRAWAAEDEDEGRDRRTQDKASGKGEGLRPKEGVAPRPTSTGGSGLLSGPLGDLLLASATAAATQNEWAHPKAERPFTDMAPEAAGQAVCLLCRRAFDSLEKLKKHEEKSQLHAENVAKAAAQQQQSQPPPSQQQGYRDRASERRQLYGQDDKPKSLTQERRQERLLKMQAQAPSHTHRPPPQDEGPMAAIDRPLGDDNIGSQMLRSLGWREGQGLGREGGGITEPVTANGAQAGADKGGLGCREKGGSDYHTMRRDGTSHRDAAKEMARSRYERTPHTSHEVLESWAHPHTGHDRR